MRSAIEHFKRCDEDLVGELRPAEFRAMCEDMGWGADDIEQSVALLRLNDDGRITLPHFVSWYTDAGVVRNVFAEFDADADQKLRFGEFAALCESSSSVELQAREVEQLFNRYDCTQATGPHDDDTMHVGEWLDTRLGLDEYTEAFVSQGFDTLASLRSAALTDAELRDIGVHKLRHRKAILSLVSQEGYLKESDLNRLFHTAQQSRVAREQLQLVKCGELEHWLAPERQFRDGNRWKRGYVTLWLAGATARLTVYESKEKFHRLTDNIVRSWVADPKGSTLELLHASASVRPHAHRRNPARVFIKDSSKKNAGRRSTTG